jgi:transposase-like protein
VLSFIFGHDSILDSSHALVDFLKLLFPGAHWLHIRTTNPSESTFATVRLRTTKTRGCVSRESILAMVFKPGMSAQRKGRVDRRSTF